MSSDSAAPMIEGLVAYVALLLAFGVALIHPGIPAVALVLFVAGCVVLEQTSRPTEDGQRNGEQDD